MAMKMSCRHFRHLKGRTNISMVSYARSVSIRGLYYHLSMLRNVSSKKVIRAMKAKKLQYNLGLNFYACHEAVKRKKKKKGNFFFVLEVFLLSLTVNINFTLKMERQGYRNIILYTFALSHGKVYSQVEITSYLTGISVPQKQRSIIFVCKAVGVLLAVSSVRVTVEFPPR